MLNQIDQGTGVSQGISSGGGRSAAQPATPDTAATYLPEPSSTGLGVFRDVMDIARAAAGEVGGVSLDATGSFAELIQAQIQAQMEMQTTSLISNLERSKHESKMAAIRNIRLS
ncbi:MAG: hypothetical protein U0136_06155 [Bdellovibrionota bacterium]